LTDHGLGSSGPLLLLLLLLLLRSYAPAELCAMGKRKNRSRAMCLAAKRRGKGPNPGDDDGAATGASAPLNTQVLTEPLNCAPEAQIPEPLTLGPAPNTLHCKFYHQNPKP